MANDAVKSTGVIRGVDSSGNERNVATDASGNLLITASGGGDAVTVADGADVAEGATSDAAVITNATGTVSSKLRGLVAIFADIWDSANHFFKVSLLPATSGGLSIYRNLDTQTAGVRIKSGAGQVYGYYISNNAATARFVKLYDSNNNPPTSADTPVLTLQIPAAAAANVAFANGVAFAAGIGIRASTGVADNDAGAPTANDVIVNLLYK